MHEFRVCLGYSCHRAPCALCGDHHRPGDGRAGYSCEDSDTAGTSYVVTHVAEARYVAEARSATKAWARAREAERDRLVPLEVARDAIAAGRIEDARTIMRLLESEDTAVAAIIAQVAQ